MNDNPNDPTPQLSISPASETIALELDTDDAIDLHEAVAALHRISDKIEAMSDGRDQGS